MDITVVLEQLADIRRRIAAKPDLVYGTVTQVSPLRVRLDGDSIALTYTPSCTFAGAVAVDDRVALVRKGLRYVAIGIVNTAPDTGWLTTGITAASGWDIADVRVRRVGATAAVHFKITRTGADITIGADGNIGNITVATLPEGFRPGSYGQPLAASLAGRVASFYANQTGAVSLCAVAPGSNITSGTEFSCGGVLIV